MSLIDLFRASFTERRDATALEWAESNSTVQSWTFGDLDLRSNQLARLLRQRGLRQGDRLAAYLSNRVEFIDLYLACVKSGVLFVPINVLYKEREVAHIIRDAEPKTVVTDSELPHPFPAWRCDELSRESRHSSAEPLDSAFDSDSPAALVYTSGTTGTSKGAVLTHGNFASNARNLLSAWHITQADRLLLSLPLFHVHGLGNGLHCWLATACRMRLQPRFETSKTAEAFIDFRPTLFFGVPTMYVRLLELPENLAHEIGKSMRLFVSGSAPLPGHVLEAFHQRFGHTILERYGMTETMMNLSNPYLGERRPGSVGVPLPNVSVKLLGQDGAPVANQETGELYVRGPNVFREYWRNSEATEQAFIEGYFRTGDLATRSPDGYYTLLGRRCDLIISGGFNIYPREIEDFLTEQPEVAEAAVIGVPDRLRGEVPVAYLVARSAIDLAELEQRCREALASFKVPRAFHVVEKLPRNALGKIQKHLLQQMGS
ncbi:MAG: AMP-binding protein [Acidimicrobiia bacterium]|nr:AMP-binding protein [Acidimicrobiia bacterium]